MRFTKLVVNVTLTIDELLALRKKLVFLRRLFMNIINDNNLQAYICKMKTINVFQMKKTSQNISFEDENATPPPSLKKNELIKKYS